MNTSSCVYIGNMYVYVSIWVSIHASTGVRMFAGVHGTHVCMYVCMHACMYVRLHAHMHKCICVCMSACLHVSTFTCLHVSTYDACMHACACAWMHVPIWESALCANVSVQAYVCKCIRICNMRKCCICVCVRACVYAYDHVCSEGVLTGRPQLRGSCPKVYSLASRTTSLCTPKACQT